MGGRGSRGKKQARNKQYRLLSQGMHCLMFLAQGAVARFRLMEKCGFVDTHCHLLELLLELGKRNTIRDIITPWNDISVHGKELWRRLRVLRGDVGGACPTQEELDFCSRGMYSPSMTVARRKAFCDFNVRTCCSDRRSVRYIEHSSSSYEKGNLSDDLFCKEWSSLDVDQTDILEQLGFKSKDWPNGAAGEKWNNTESWGNMTGAEQQLWSKLGFDRQIWDTWTKGTGQGHRPSSDLPRVGSVDINASSNDQIVDAFISRCTQSGSGKYMPWEFLRKDQLQAAQLLGFTKGIWDETLQAPLAELGPLISQWASLGLKGMITSCCDPFALRFYRRILPLLQKELESHDVVLSMALGCHPKTAGVMAYDRNWKYLPDAFFTELTEFAAELSCNPMYSTHLVAWGECGLDYSHKRYGGEEYNRRSQQNLFRKQLEFANEGTLRRLPVVIHSRDAERDTLTIMKELLDKERRIHMHAFMPKDVTVIDTYLKEFRNLFIGFAGCIQQESRERAKCCPVDRIVLETDSPWLAPPSMVDNPWVVQLSEPGQISSTASVLAGYMDVQVDKFAEQVFSNTIACYDEKVAVVRRPTPVD